MSTLAAPARDDLWTAWSLDPIALAAAAVAIAFFLQGWRRLHRRPRRMRSIAIAMVS